MTANSGAAAVGNGRQVSSYDSGMCQKFVRGQCWEVGSLFGSAIEAWQGARLKHPGDRTPPHGAPVYYEGGQYGHAVIFTDPGRMRSTDCTSTGRVSDTDLAWPERTWGYRYLGWTGDINGVTLPLDGGGDTDTGEDNEMPNYAHAKTGEAAMRADEWAGVEWDTIVSDPDDVMTAGQPGAIIPDSPYLATFHASVTAPEGTTIRTRTVEMEKTDSGAWEIAETGRTVEHLATDGGSYVQDTRTGWCNKGRRLWWQVRSDAGGTMDSADVVLLFWPA